MPQNIPNRDVKAVAERLLAAERARQEGIRGYSVNEFKQNMREAIKKERCRVKCEKHKKR